MANNSSFISMLLIYNRGLATAVPSQGTIELSSRLCGQKMTNI